MSYVYVIAEINPPYIFECDVNAVKIGYTSTCVYSRARQMQTGNSSRLFVLMISEFQGPNMAASVERIMHWSCKPHLINGEWYKYHEILDELDALRRLGNSASFYEMESFCGARGISFIKEMTVSNGDPFKEFYSAQK